MRIIRYFDSDRKSHWLGQIGRSDWSAGVLLYELLDKGTFFDQDCRCQGSAPGQTGGGEVSFDIPNDFYLSMTSEELAEKCWRTKSIISGGVLAAFMEKAKSKGGFMLDFTKG